MAIFQHTDVSAASPGRSTSTEGSPLKLRSLFHKTYLGSCSTGSWVGPSSPTRNASWVQIYFTGSSMSAAMRTAGFMVVGEYEECAACADEAAEEGDAVHYGSYGELGHTCMQECAGEVAVGECMSILEECVGLCRSWRGRPDATIMLPTFLASSASTSADA